jgi:hypothetical protein
VTVAWLAEVGIIAVRDLAGPRRFPLPSELLSTFVVFGGLGLVSQSSAARGAASATAWGIVVATLLSAKVDFLKPVGDFFGGGSVSATSTPTGPAIAGVAAPRSTAPGTSNLRGQARPAL